MSMHRRALLASMAGLAGGLVGETTLARALPSPGTPVQNDLTDRSSSTAMRPLGKGAKAAIKPPRLMPGQTIGLVAPGSPAPEDEDLAFAAELVTSLGFKVKRGKNLGRRHGYLAGTDQERAADLNAFFEDPEVSGIFAFRGGYGSLRTLPHLNFEALAKTPKVLLGFSDITALLNAAYKKAGLVSFHGPIAWWSFTDYTWASFKAVLMEGRNQVLLGNPPPFEIQPGRVRETHRLTTLTGGKARGPLVGGNLATLTQLLGTPYEPPFDGHILFLEEVEEAPYRLDFMLTHLRLSGRLDKVAGIAFGKCTDCDSEMRGSFSIEAVLKDRLSDLGIPVLRGLLIGHIEDQATVPIGAMAELDADAGTLTLVESAVE